MADDVDMDAPQISTLREETTPEPNPTKSKFRVKLVVHEKAEGSRAGSTTTKHGRAESDEDDDDDDEEEEDQLIDDDDDEVQVAKPLPPAPPPVPPPPQRGVPGKRGGRGRGGGRRGRGGGRAGALIPLTLLFSALMRDLRCSGRPGRSPRIMGSCCHARPWSLSSASGEEEAWSSQRHAACYQKESIEVCHRLSSRFRLYL